MRSNFLPVLLTAAAIAWAQVPSSTPDDKPASIEGTVTNALTGEPLLRAHVTLRGMAGKDRHNLGVLTDAEGHFSISVPAGTYAAIAERVGFSQTANRVGRMGAQVTVKAGDKTDLKLKLNPNGAISGRVTDPDGEPVEGVTVSAVSAEGGSAQGTMSSSQTDEKGQFRLGGLAPGKYRVKANPTRTSMPAEIRSDGTAESQYAQTYYPNSLTTKGASSVNLATGAEAGGVSIQLLRIPIVRVSGTVIGAPAGERVSIEAMTPNFGGRQMGAMRQDGTFDLWRLDPGKYLVSAFVTVNGQNWRSAPVEVEVAASNIDHIELRLVPPFDLAGQVQFDDEKARQGPQLPPNAGQRSEAPPPKPPPMVLVLRETAGRSGGSVKLADDGSFVAEGLGPGRYRVSTAWGGVYVKSMRLGQMNFDGDILDLTGGANGAALTVLISSATAEISGVVSDDKGPVAQIPVGVMRIDSGPPTFPSMTATGDDGSYKLSGVAPGKYKLLATVENLWARAQDDDTEGVEIIEVNNGDKLTKDLKVPPPVGK